MDGDEIKNLLEKYLQVMINENIDKLVLGCTHYPLLSNLFQKFYLKQLKLLIVIKL